MSLAARNLGQSKVASILDQPNPSAALKAWGSYVDSVNMAALPEWSSKVSLPNFIGSLGSRFHFKPWAMILLYIGGFIVPGPAAAGVAYGLWIFVRRSRERLLGLWLVALAVYYVVWFGQCGTAQSYYNLPAMGPVCALFGIGVSALLGSAKSARWRSVLTVAAVLALALPAAPVLRYLFKQDRRILSAAAWIRQHTQPGDVVIYRPNHRYDMLDYNCIPVMAYYAERPTFVWTRLTPEAHQAAALARAHYAVVTLPEPLAGGLAGKLNAFRGISAPLLQPLDWLANAGFVKTTDGDGFTIYERP